jgi:hypothetical protein
MVQEQILKMDLSAIMDDFTMRDQGIMMQVQRYVVSLYMLPYVGKLFRAFVIN